MERIRHLIIPILLLSCCLWLAGCDEAADPVATAEPEPAALDLDADYGGLTATDEAVAFGDADLALDDAELAAESDDPLQSDPEVLALEADAASGDPALRPEITVLRLTWGRLDAALDAPVEDVELLDWSGRLHVDAGLAVARRVILFERPRDHLVLPRIDRRTVAWVSHTGRHYDGLIAEIIAPRPDEAADAEPVVVHLVTPLVELHIPLADLAGLDRTVVVDEAGNALRLEGHRLGEEDLCPRGFLGGAWVVEEDPETGADGWFRGRWTGLWGRVQGHLAGIWGVDEAGEAVFHGKYIDRFGRFCGLITGTYAAGEEPGRGVFRGEWVNAAGTVEGVLGGDWVASEERPGGFFGGRWATLCDEEAAESLR